jgi:hypothetical protein
MAGTIVADTIRADSTSTLVLRNGVANTPPTIQDTNGTQVGTFCRAWVNFNGQSANPITPRASFNVSSVSKNATGDYTINFTNAMPDANYAPTFGFTNSNNLAGGSIATMSATALRFYNATAGNTGFDGFWISSAVFR